MGIVYTMFMLNVEISHFLHNLQFHPGVVLWKQGQFEAFNGHHMYSVHISYLQKTSFIPMVIFLWLGTIRPDLYGLFF